jgi:hypothetical protein
VQEVWLNGDGVHMWITMEEPCLQCRHVRHHQSGSEELTQFTGAYMLDDLKVQSSTYNLEQVHIPMVFLFNNLGVHSMGGYHNTCY